MSSILGAAIAHARWAPDRRESLDRLKTQWPSAFVSSSVVREHASIWAPRLWGVFLDVKGPGDEWCVFLNDDVTIAPRLVFAAALDAVPPEVDLVSLATIQPEAKAAAEAGQRWIASYCATGPGYAIRKRTIPDLLEFHAKTLTAGMRAKMNEDEVLSHFAWSRQRPFWHCVPALVRHDTTVKSTLGYDNHPGRVATMLWDEYDGIDDDDPWRNTTETIEMCPHPWMGEGRMRAVRRAYLNGWDFNDICVFCADRPVLIQSPTTGAGICGQCLADGCGHILTNARCA